MKCLVVTTHPLADSLCIQLTRYVVRKLEGMGHQVTVEDLYAENFEPALTTTERKSYYTHSYDSSSVKEQADRLLDAEGLVLLFPTWWFGFPAMLKGWFDRVWGPGIAYNHAPDYGTIQPRLDNLRKVLAITTLGAPWWLDRLIMRQPVKKVLKIALLGACARKSTLQYLSLYNSEKINKPVISKFQKKIEAALADWKL